MSYRIHCDWCGEHLGQDDDRALMPVTIQHPGVKTVLGVRWAEETEVTRHFCASPAEDTDHNGRNRMGLVPVRQFDSCYDRAIAAITRTKLEDPGLGMEWRLVPVGDNPRPAKALTIEHLHEESAKWGRLSREERNRQVLEAIGVGRLTITEVTKALRDQLGEHVVYSSNVRAVITRLAAAGELDRVGESFQGKVRYRYFRKTDASVVA